MSDNKNVLIEVRDLCKSFDHVKVLNGISTTISQGEVVAIIGMRKIYVSALHESSGKTNLRFHSF